MIDGVFSEADSLDCDLLGCAWKTAVRDAIAALW